MPAEHNPEPWKWCGTVDDLDESGRVDLLGCAGGYLADAGGVPLLVPADAECYSASLCAAPGVAARIVACVNACKGREDSVLEDLAAGRDGFWGTEKGYQGMLDRVQIREQRDRLLAVLGPLLALTEQFAHAVNPECFAQLEAEGKLPSSILEARAAIAAAAGEPS